MKKKKADVNLLKFPEKARREDEINRYGKIISLRPSRAMESKKIYKRKKYKYKDED